jgi:tetratricopeptide (TPR) repeat protein
MQMTKTQKIIAVVVVALILFGVYVFIKNKSEPVSDNTQTISTTTGKTVINGKGYTIEQVPVDEGKGVPQPIPDLNREVSVYAGAIVASEAKISAEAKIKTLQERLKKNPADYSAWIDLGIYQKSGGDYEGAIISWQYASKLAPTDYIAPANIGNLYAYFIKDKAQAEIYFKKAISNSPTQVYLYVQLAEIYRDIFKDINKARAIIDQGLSKVPSDQGLLQFKASLN